MSSPTRKIHPVESRDAGRLADLCSRWRASCARAEELQQAERAGSLNRGVSVGDPEFAVERVLLGFDGVERYM
jgi:hypothetical protein